MRSTRWTAAACSESSPVSTAVTSIVEVIDTGPGWTRPSCTHIFEPFFTTKDVGKGTGLGLDISRRIVVDRHGGDMTFESVPGSTTARVRLPLQR